jgi:hypothetical protein
MGTLHLRSVTAAREIPPERSALAREAPGPGDERPSAVGRSPATSDARPSADHDPRRTTDEGTGTAFSRRGRPRTGEPAPRAETLAAVTTRAGIRSPTLSAGRSRRSAEDGPSSHEPSRRWNGNPLPPSKTAASGRRGADGRALAREGPEEGEVSPSRLLGRGTGELGWTPPALFGITRRGEPRERPISLR